MVVFEFKINSNFFAVKKTILETIEKLEKFKFSKEQLFDIRLSLNEALVNALKHGNKFDPKKYIYLKIYVFPKKIEIEVKDEGKGFNYKKIPLPTKEKNIEKLSGRGIFLIKTLMDKVEFFDGGKTIKMVKLLQKEEK
ncbi:MAG: ATP-binding protein [Candidatus Aenigmatarchaeota archaeon]